MKLDNMLRAVASSWLAVSANAVVGFLLTPYLLHHLGAVEFGLYTLVTALSGYYGLFDLGIRSAVLRFVSRALSLNDREETNRVVCSAFYFYWAICAIAIVATVLLLPWLPTLFGVSGQTALAFQHLVLLAGILQGLIFPLNVFAGSLDASGRFDWVYMIQTFSLLLRVVVVIVTIRAGGHLFEVGSVVLLSGFLAYLLQVPFAVRELRTLSLSPKWVSKSKLREMLSYASVTLGVGVGDKLKANIFPVIIGVFLNPFAVTLFSIPTRLLRFPLDGASTMTEVVNPASSYLDARKDYAALRRLLLLTAQGAFLLLVPMSAFLIIFGRDVLRLWVGVGYLSTYPLLVVLTLGMGAGATQAGLQAILFGIGRHKGLIAYRLAEAAAFVLLGAVALKFAGLEAFAIVVSFTLLLTSLILVPRHVCRIVGLPIRSYLWAGCFKPSLLAIPFAVVLLGIRRAVFITSWFEIMAALALGGLTFGGTLLWAAFWPQERAGFSGVSLDILKVLTDRFRSTAFPLLGPRKRNSFLSTLWSTDD
jgi:O-antigen/teichoic acid export membrane protein